jgi:drug/metabolite transporter (DMT)-like permease
MAWFLRLIRLSWVVFVHALLLSVESIGIEVLSTKFGLAPLTIAGNSILIAGVALLAMSASVEKKQSLSIFRDWKYLVPASVLIAAGIFFWYDSVDSVGASKEGLLSGPLEVVVILLLARLVLKERLDKKQGIGAVVALVGFFAGVMSAGSTELLLTWGDFEAMISAISFGTGVVFVTRLTANHSALRTTGSSLLISGAVLSAILWISVPTITTEGWVAILSFSMLPLFAAFTYVLGLSRIGASMTSVIGSFSILLTILIQIILLVYGVDMLVPSNILLAVIGGVLGILGIFLIHKRGN